MLIIRVRRATSGRLDVRVGDIQRLDVLRQTIHVVVRRQRRGGLLAVAVLLMDVTVAVVLVQRTPGAFIAKANGYLAGIWNERE